MAAARPSRVAMSIVAKVKSFALKKSGDQARLACCLNYFRRGREKYEVEKLLLLSRVFGVFFF